MSEHIKLAALARHLHESVLQRASDAGVDLPFDQAAAVMSIAIGLARIAYGEHGCSPPWRTIESAAFDARVALPGND